MTIRVDLHVHAKVSKTIPFQMEAFQRAVRRAMEVGLNGFAITEHFHSTDFWEGVAHLRTALGQCARQPGEALRRLGTGILRHDRNRGFVGPSVIRDDPEYVLAQ